MSHFQQRKVGDSLKVVPHKLACLPWFKKESQGFHHNLGQAAVKLYLVACVKMCMSPGCQGVPLH